MNYIFKGLQIHSETETRHDACLVVKNNKIYAIDSAKNIANYSPAEILEFPAHYHLVPGFIDLHVHGANGSDVMDATTESLTNISKTLAKEGTTGFLATTMSASSEKIATVLASVAKVMTHPNEGAAILGVHLEGPFLSAKKAGAQSKNEILSPKIEYIDEWQKKSNDAIKLVTLAPELPGSLGLIKYLSEKNIIVSLGHTDATFDESMAAIAAGCTHVTHLFNAMRGIHHRDPGTVTAALLSDAVYAELILDGHHLHPEIVRLTLKLKGADKIILVTDAMRAKCMCDGEYDLGGQSVTVKNAKATLGDGTLAGSVLKMNSALRNMIEFAGCSLADAIKMTSANQARSLGIFSQKGSIAINKDADLVVLDENLNVVMTMCNGRIAYQAEVSCCN